MARLDRWERQIFIGMYALIGVASFIVAGAFFAIGINDAKASANIRPFERTTLKSDINVVMQAVGAEVFGLERLGLETTALPVVIKTENGTVYDGQVLRDGDDVEIYFRSSETSGWLEVSHLTTSE